MTNEVTKALGTFSNSEFLFGPDGKIVYMNPWSNGNELRNKLEELLGPSESITTVESLKLPEVIDKSSSYEGVVPRLEIDEAMFPLIIEPQMKESKFFIKLRVEVNGELLATGNGNMYLGFHLDPVHHVHWNNLAAPLSYEIEVGDGTQVDPSSAKGPEVEQASDTDPREFLVKVNNWNKDQLLRLTVNYFACDENDRWCIPLSQHYKIHRNFDHTGGRVYNRSFWEYHKSSVIEAPIRKN